MAGMLNEINSAGAAARADGECPAPSMAAAVRTWKASFLDNLVAEARTHAPQCFALLRLAPRALAGRARQGSEGRFSAFTDLSRWFCLLVSTEQGEARPRVSQEGERADARVVDRWIVEGAVWGAASSGVARRTRQRCNRPATDSPQFFVQYYSQQRSQPST